MGSVRTRVREYESLAWAAKRLEVPEARVKGFAAQGLIGVKRMPGMPTRYCRADLERLRAQSIVPAMSEAVFA